MTFCEIKQPITARHFALMNDCMLNFFDYYLPLMIVCEFWCHFDWSIV